jgi:hypothetical protein
MRVWLVSASVFMLALGCDSSPGGQAPPARAPQTASSGLPATGGSSATLSTALDAGMTRVRALVERPNRLAIDDGFAPSILAEVPGTKWQSLFDDIHRHLSPCSSQRVISTGGDTSARLHVDCTGGGLDVTIAVEAAQPYRITGLVITPSR